MLSPHRPVFLLSDTKVVLVEVRLYSCGDELTYFWLDPQGLESRGSLSSAAKGTKLARVAFQEVT